MKSIFKRLLFCLVFVVLGYGALYLHILNFNGDLPYDMNDTIHNVRRVLLAVSVFVMIMPILIPRRYSAYFGTVMKHKWFVFLACIKMGVPIIPSIIHDWDKFLPSMMIAYARYFNDPDDGTPRSDDRTEQEKYDFDVAWLGHQNRNKHHWQYWMLKEDSGAMKLMAIPARHLREMVADWMGAGRTYNPDYKADSTKKWYLGRRKTIQMNEVSRLYLEGLLGVTEADWSLVGKKFTVATPNLTEPFVWRVISPVAGALDLWSATPTGDYLKGRVGTFNTFEIEGALV